MAKDNIKGLRPETLAVAFGYDPEMGMGSVKPPIFMTSTFVYPSAQHAKDVHEAYFDGTGPLVGETNHIYSRLGHPGLDFLEKRLAAIDGAEEAVAYSSGMAAHSSIALAYVRPGDSVLHGRPIYGGVDMLYNSIMPQFGSHVAAYTDGTDENDVRKAADEAMAKGPLKLIIAETPANPTAAVVDLDLMVRIADEVGAKQGHRPLVVVDNTLLGPFAQRPIEHGVDLCMTSLTKYCGGHSDLLAGGISGRKELIDHLRMQRTTWGNHLDPYTSWLVLRSLESVAVRTERAMQNARGVAEFLRDHPKVAGVTYLGFLEPGTRRRAVFDRQCKAAGSTFSFHLHGGEAEAFRMLDQLKLLKVAVSLGGSETLICHSASTTHYAVPPAQRLAGGITDGTIRLSVGLEHVDDLIGDLRQALEAV
ncbi:MAG: methionine gamma-lyase [Sphingomonadales bacterium 35-56-22]|jgi:cystathionine gamma-synthase/methionine-gamma-lyase|uniref:cystathionine gamma-synthase family protein n=1 Tax=Sphingorhabdus sp. TaxID=1902408 RepID=UPI000BCDE624|nr:cystathionine gamma-synthase family protein [Sphingorhabdus sp.]OYY15210.1 MAG: methionine gamma-lyase [Sphingomonadales bacterium 35-56-22]OYY97968.1 MAG: methionine gamma-lyase [Sphingomonadales bacterium 28-56-43]OYZ61163.1 MAG: methionine gamma-lyase [Sphingomonadales bacterium 24-56-14]OZA83193.1 MAG: methionine gamma-lyase [Sphingomonadales bacterium 39-57-19]HQS12436.1 cystathionine gamma-synthase family protein [Sphingorhabdus sp.]